MIEQRSRRKHERIRVAGGVRLMADTSDGLRMLAGQLVDLSEGGCAILSQTRIEERVAARIQVEVDGVEIWLPVVTRWARCDPRGWTIGCSFDRPVDEKQRAIRALVWERRKLMNG
jgi:hypothetical protein